MICRPDDKFIWQQTNVVVTFDFQLVAERNNAEAWYSDIERNSVNPILYRVTLVIPEFKAQHLYLIFIEYSFKRTFRRLVDRFFKFLRAHEFVNSWDVPGAYKAHLWEDKNIHSTYILKKEVQLREFLWSLEFQKELRQAD